MNNFIETPHDNKPITLSQIPNLTKDEFVAQYNEILNEPKHTLIAYFANPNENLLQLFTIIADNKNKTLKIFSTTLTKHNDTIKSLAN